MIYICWHRLLAVCVQPEAIEQTTIVGAQRGQPLWAHNMDKGAIVGAQHGQPLWAHNVDSHCGRTTWTAIVGAQHGQGCHCGCTTWRRVPSVPYFAPYKWSHVSGLHPCDWFIRYMAIFSPEECPELERSHQTYGLATPKDFTLPPHNPLWTELRNVHSFPSEQ